MNLTPGARLGVYEIAALLGEGGMDKCSARALLAGGIYPRWRRDGTELPVGSDSRFPSRPRTELDHSRPDAGEVALASAGSEVFARARAMSRWLTLLILCAGLAVAAPGASRAAGPALRVLGGGNVEAILMALAPDFERATGQSLSMSFGRASELRARVESGEMADVVVIMRSDLDALARARRVVPEGVVDVARSAIGVAVRAGTPLPDMRSREAATRALLSAPSLAYADPARGTTSGLFVASLLEDLGIAERVRAKTTLVVSDRPVGEAVASLVARGDAALGVGQLSEMLPVGGIAFVSPLAKELQPDLIVAAGVSTDARNRDGALTFIRYLLSPRGAAVFNARGMTPP